MFAESSSRSAMSLMPRGAASGRAVLGMDDLVEFLVDMELASDLVFSLDAFEAFICTSERKKQQTGKS